MNLRLNKYRTTCGKLQDLDCTSTSSCPYARVDASVRKIYLREKVDRIFVFLVMGGRDVTEMDNVYRPVRALFVLIRPGPK